MREDRLRRESSAPSDRLRIKETLCAALPLPRTILCLLKCSSFVVRQNETEVLTTESVPSAFIKSLPSLFLLRTKFSFRKTQPVFPPCGLYEPASFCVKHSENRKRRRGAKS